MNSKAIFNGLDGTTGEYLFAPATVTQLARKARAAGGSKTLQNELSRMARLAKEPTLGPTHGLDARDLAQVGWGLILPSRSDPRIREALQPLTELRQTEAGDLYREFIGEQGYRPDESKFEFLARHKASSGPVQPRQVPYYLLLVGTPEEIPFRFQYQLGVQYAVGRLSLDSPDSYKSYADAVVAASRVKSDCDKTLALFGVRNPNDRATQFSYDNLIEPLARSLDDLAGWRVTDYSGEKASKERLSTLLGGAKTPSVLLTASHGLGFPQGHANQLPFQGALVCQDWNGPQTPIGRKAIFCAEDLSDSAELRGLLSFHFACYSGGTPDLDSFNHEDPSQANHLAERAFMAALPKQLLGHPHSPALAVIGHVDRAWGHSFYWAGAGAQIEVFRSCLAKLAQGYPIGSAMDSFSTRYAELASDLKDLREQESLGRTCDPTEFAAIWTACNDARSYVILGDPAVRPT